MSTEAGDGIKVVENGGSHSYVVSVEVDDDTIKIEDGKLVATAQVPEVDDVTVKLNGDGKLSVPIDEDTIYVDGGQLKAKQADPVEVDDVTIVYNSEGKLEAVKQALDIDEKTIQLINDKLTVAIDNDTIVFDSEHGWLKVDGSIDFAAENGLYLRDNSETDTVYIGIDYDSETMKIVDGKLTAIGDPLPKPYLPDTWLHSNSECELEWGEPETVPVDEETIIYNPEKD